uniref:Uncharacterized protein n=1 Tax=Candidatus Kentrum sp. FW TaxID=2126338 RepID=A0A450TV03_9GAMM|nr:MAG: hypothetical protein BECKFW1821C_GA0114237_103610 [Candidatus Kentron sp. FW]
MVVVVIDAIHGRNEIGLWTENLGEIWMIISRSATPPMVGHFPQGKISEGYAYRLHRITIFPTAPAPRTLLYFYTALSKAFGANTTNYTNCPY